MNIEIATIRVSVSGDEWEGKAISHEFQWHLERALKEIALRELPEEMEELEVDELHLAPLDWRNEPDKTFKLVRLILEALEN